MRMGKLRRRLKIQYKSVTRDSFGQEVVSWVDLATVWGSVQGAGGREFQSAGGEQAEESWKIRIRYRSDLDRDMRIIETSTNQTFRIEAISDPDGRRREMVISCNEWV